MNPPEAELRIPSAIELNGICYRRSGRAILKDIQWRVARGACAAIIGPNGAGKSTMLALITGHLWPHEGSVLVLGETYGRVDLTRHRERIGFVGHSRLPEFHGELTAFETVLAGRWGKIIIPPRQRVTEEDEAMAREELAMVGMGERADMDFGQLSSGEQMRTLLARALVARPELLILDEPTASLDIAARGAFVGVLDRLAAHRPELTILIVTHHVEELPRATREVLLLREGRIVAAGPIAATLTSQDLSATFGCDIELDAINGHYHPRLRAVPEWTLSQDVP